MAKSSHVNITFPLSFILFAQLEWIAFVSIKQYFNENKIMSLRIIFLVGYFIFASAFSYSNEIEINEAEKANSENFSAHTFLHHDNLSTENIQDNGIYDDVKDLSNSKLLGAIGLHLLTLILLLLSRSKE